MLELKVRNEVDIRLVKKIWEDEGFRKRFASSPTQIYRDELSKSGAELPARTTVKVVEESDKQRFELAPDLSRVRARQGHSVAVELALPPTPPPALLYHGTVERFLAAILREGLQRMARHHVHLSPDVETAVRVGARRGRAVVLEIDAAAMSGAGHVFFVTSNGVWLTEAVPPAFLRRRERG